jgi:hypothetical protein
MATNLFSKQMSVWVDGSALGCAQDFTLSVNKDVIEIACLNSTGAKTSVPDMYGWTVSFSGMVQTTSTHTGTGYEDLMDEIISNTATDVSIYILPNVSTNAYYVGSGILSSVEMSGGVGSAVSYSGTITGNGALVKATTA